MAPRRTNFISKIKPQPIHHERLRRDFEGIIKDKNYEDIVAKKWEHNHGLIVLYGVQPFLNTSWLKCLKYGKIDGLEVYELRYKTILEIRIIFILQKGDPVYLTAFCKNNNLY